MIMSGEHDAQDGIYGQAIDGIQRSSSSRSASKWGGHSLNRDDHNGREDAEGNSASEEHRKRRAQVVMVRPVATLQTSMLAQSLMESRQNSSGSGSRLTSTGELDADSVYPELRVDVVAAMNTRPASREISETKLVDFGVDRPPDGAPGLLAPSSGGTPSPAGSSIDGEEWGDDGADPGATPAAGSGLVSAGLPFEIVQSDAAANASLQAAGESPLHRATAPPGGLVRRRRVGLDAVLPPPVPAITVSSLRRHGGRSKDEWTGSGRAVGPQGTPRSGSLAAALGPEIGLGPEPEAEARGTTREQ